MIPLRSTTRSGTVPLATAGLIILNVLVFFFQVMQGDALQGFVYTYGLVPARYTVPEIAAGFGIAEQLLPLITFSFLHGGFLHLLGNMWFLYLFGDTVEDSLGPLPFLIFYLFCGLLSGVVHLACNLHSQIPVIGASGAVAGVMGAYFIRFPRSRILTLVPILFVPFLVEVPAGRAGRPGDSASRTRQKGRRRQGRRRLSDGADPTGFPVEAVRGRSTAIYERMGL